MINFNINISRTLAKVIDYAYLFNAMKTLGFLHKFRLHERKRPEAFIFNAFWPYLGHPWMS